MSSERANTPRTAPVRGAAQSEGIPAGDETSVVLKLGGELLEEPGRLAAAAESIVALGACGPLVVVHGGGREIDAELARHGIPKQSVDGLRVTDPDTLSVVVAVLAGTINTRLVAAVGRAGGRAVGLTGADDRLGLVDPAPLHQATDGRAVDLGCVGVPVAEPRSRLLEDLLVAGYVPVVACIGVGRDGRLFNVNADTLAAHLAVQLRARRLIVAGGTAGVLDRRGSTVPSLDVGALGEFVTTGQATAGMVAKLVSCREALEAGVGEVLIVDGRRGDFANAPGTTITHLAAARRT